MEDVANLTDEELVQLVCTKDQELYREVVRRYQDKLMRYATYLIQDEGRATDVVQEAFIKSFVNLQGFNPKKKFSSWIYRIVHNEAINNLKKHKKEMPLEDAVSAEKIAIGSLDEEEGFDKRQLKKIVVSCLDRLPLIYSSPLALFYLEGKPYEEISDVLRIPIGTVGTRISRGKRLLATICREEGLETYATS
jgi:RNA polymerase sigma-70 factor (ECF subfamily)